jgi:hypothetical protein
VHDDCVRRQRITQPLRVDPDRLGRHNDEDGGGSVRFSWITGREDVVGQGQRRSAGDLATFVDQPRFVIAARDQSNIVGVACQQRGDGRAPRCRADDGDPLRR